MLGLKYKLTSNCAAVLHDSDCEKVVPLPIGSLIFPTTTIPDEAGMIAGVCEGQAVRLFVRDLEERAERIEIRKPPATVRAMPAPLERTAHNRSSAD